MTEWTNTISKGEGYEDNNIKKTELQMNRKRYYFEIIKYGYLNLMKNSLVVTNSEFSRKAIAKIFKLDDIRILSPPIDVETFHTVLL